MKKLLLYSAAALLAAGALNAKTIDEVRIYLNPGHGSWGPNDRPNATIPYPNLSNGMPDTCGFYESNTNLWKVLKLGNTLEKMGVKKENIMYSRVKNGPFPYVKGAPDAEQYNRSLSEICTEVEANNIDIFLSVHSNAASEGTSTNYPLFIYRGTDGADGNAVEGSYEMGKTMWPIFYTNGIDVTSFYSPTNPNIRGDISFYGSSDTRVDPNNGKSFTGYLGVLKHGAQGFLSEGYFHTYQPARHRALNKDYCGQEGVRYARGLCAWLGGKAETTGYIMGTVKDLHEKMSNPLFNYTAKTNDQWVPINGAKVTLYKAGTEVASYTVDNNYNGVFVFEGLQPGDDYTLDITADGYKPLFDEYKAPITVKANETTYPMVYLEATDYEPPKIVYTDYPDEINNPAIGAAKAYNFKEVYANAEIAELSGKTIRRTILRGNNLYVLALDADKKPYVYIIDATTKAVVKTLGTEGTEGSILALSDIQLTAEGVLVGCAKTLNQFDNSVLEAGETRGKLNIYKWATDEATGLPDGNPAVWFTTQKTGNFYRAYTGGTMLYKGTLEDGTIVLSAETTSSSTNVWNIVISIADGAFSSDSFNNKIGSTVTKNLFGNDYTFTLSPIDEDFLVATGSKHAPRTVSALSTSFTDLAEGLINKPSANVSFFKYAGHSFMVAGDEVDGKSVTKIIDVTNGFDKATLVKVNVESTTTAQATEAQASEAQGIIAATGRTIVTKDENELTTAANIELVTMKGNGAISKLTTDAVAQPKFRANYAYDLSVDNFTLKFKSTGDAPKATIVVKNDTEEHSFTLNNVVKGENSFGIPANTLTDGAEYSWSVEIESDAIPTSSLIFSASVPSGNYRGGVTVDKDPESDLYGKIYVSTGKSSGLQVYTQDFTAEGTYLKEAFKTGNASSPLRITTSNGKLYLTDWSDAHAGLWIYDPAAGKDEVTNFFDGTKEGSGRYVNADGVAIGGGTTGVSFCSKGEDRKLYTFCEDYPTGNAGNKLIRYNVGSKNVWNQAPSAQFDAVSAKMLNTNVEVNALEQGVFVSQVRTTGNNATGVPGFLFMNHDGEILVNSGNMKDLNGCMGAGLAVNKECDLFAIVDGDGNIRIYDLTWNEGTPEFNFKFTFKTPATEINQLSFDPAGNLYAYGRNKGLLVYSITNEAPKAITPAKSTIKVIGSGVNTVETASALNVYPNPATDVVYVEAGEDIESIAIFNLTGAMVSAQANVEGSKATINVSNLAAGSYIVKVNKKAVQLIKK